VLAAPHLQPFVSINGQQPTGGMMAPGGFGGGFGASGTGVMGGPPDAGMMDPGMFMPGMAPPTVSAPAPAAAAAPGGAEGPRGIIVTINGTTPYSQPAQLLTQTLLTKLLAIGKNTYPDGHPYYIAKAEVVNLLPLAKDQQRIQAMQTAYQAALQAKQNGTTIAAPTYSNPGGIGGFGNPEVLMNGGGGFPGPAPGADAGATADAQAKAAAAAAAKAYEDRRTGETVLNDQEFTVAAVLVLDPGPKDPAAAATQPVVVPDVSEAGATSAAPGATAPGATATGATAPGATAPGATAPGATAPGATAPGAAPAATTPQ
jgi:hypothetical protein